MGLLSLFLIALLPAGAIPVAAQAPIAIAAAASSPPVIRFNQAAPATPTTFYFAEGYTGSGFQEVLSLFMPSQSGTATIDYFTPTAHTTATAALTAGKVNDVDVNAAVGPNQEVSIKVTLPGPGVAERTIHFNNGRWYGSTGQVGVTAPAVEWNFAEGSTLPIFSEFLTLQNPNANSVVVDLTYFTDAGKHPVKTLTLPANSRTTVEVFKGDAMSTVAQCIPNGSTASCGVGTGIGGVSVQAKSRTLPIIAERPFYVENYSFGSGNIKDGHVAFGANAAALIWNFAEGTTLPGFNEYLTLLNGNATTATVDLKYFTDTGVHPVKTVAVPANSRVTVEVFSGDLTDRASCSPGAGGNCGVGSGIGGVSTRVESRDQPIVVERPMYMVHNFGTGTVAGAHDAVGANTLGQFFGFAAASTMSGENDYLTIQNPGAVATHITAIYYPNAGAITRQFDVPAGTRHTVEVFNASEGAGPGLSPLAIVVAADHPVLVEKPTYSSSSATYGATDTPGASTVPPSPEAVAPPIDTTVSTDVTSATSFLLSGNPPIQNGVAPNTIQPTRAAVLRGRLLTGDGQPLAGAGVSISGHPEFGWTLSRSDGVFDLAVNGGGPLTVRYQKDTYLPVERQAQVPWQDFVWLPDVVLIQADPNVTAVDLQATTPVQVARGSTVTDSEGTRQATVFFPQGTNATMKLPDGSTKPLTSLHVRATEYTVGDSGPSAMPAELPPTSGYTYAVDLGLDEAVQAGATEVQFSRPLPVYVEDFLKAPTGWPVPLGYYDRGKGQWVASDNGLVVKILTITNNMADLDVDGSGLPASAATLSALGITDPERAQLASLYAAGQALWRMPVTHFSPWDGNYSFVPPSDATRPKGSLKGGPLDKCCTSTGSRIEVQNQTLGEDLGLTGTPFRLHYESDRVAGRLTNFSVDVPLTGATVPASLKRVDLKAYVAGQRLVQSFPATPNQTFTINWDGKDGYGRTLQGAQPVAIRVGYAYDGVFARTPRFAVPGEVNKIFGPATPREVILWQQLNTSLGAWDQRPMGLGGWSLSPNHSYDSAARVIYLGDGTRRGADATNVNVIKAVAASVNQPMGLASAPDGSLYIESGGLVVRKVAPDGTISTVAGNGLSCTDSTGICGDAGPATQATFHSIYRIALGPDGSLYIADDNVNLSKIRRVAPNGIISTFAGGFDCGSPFFCGDGGPATNARLNSARGVAVAPDGSVYIADVGNGRVRRVGPDGIITTFAGSGQCNPPYDPVCFGGDGGPATQARLSLPSVVAIGPDGSLYIDDGGNYRVRRVTPNGIIDTFAGNGISGFTGDGGPAAAAELGFNGHWGYGLAVAPDGSVYIGDISNQRIRRVGPEGVITTVAGNGSAGNSADGGPAAAAQFNNPFGIELAPDGSLFIADTSNNRVRRVASAMPGFTVADTFVAAEDGSEVYHFNGGRRHVSTLDSLSGAATLTFLYDAAGRLSAVTDGDGNVTVVEHNAAGQPTAIVAPGGQRTALVVDVNGFLSRVSDPAGHSVGLSYGSGGLLATLTDPRGGVHTFTYDAMGRLTKDQDPAGGSSTLARTGSSADYTVSLTSALNRTSTYRVQGLAAGGERRVSTDPAGFTVPLDVGTDGRATTTYPDGSTTMSASGADPRWGMQAPLPSSTFKTPAGLQASVGVSRTVDLSDPSNPFTLRTQTDTVTVNSRSYIDVYDAASRISTLTSPAGRQTTIQIDSQGRPLQQQVVGLDPVTYTYDGQGRLIKTAQGGRVVTFTYDSQNRLVSITDPASRSLSFTYDAAGRVTSEKLPDGQLVAYGYDPSGNRTSITPPGRPAHTFSFTPVDQVAQYNPPGSSNGTQYSYNADRQVTQTTRPDGTGIAFGYDSSGRLSSVTQPRGTTTTSFDAATGNLRMLTAPGGITLSLSYDGSLITGSTVAGPVAGSVSRTYDTDFRVASDSVNGGSAVTYQYDADGLLTNAGALSLNRDSHSGLVTGTALSALTTAQTYNTLGELTGLTMSQGSTARLSTQYTRDSLGRITQRAETIDGVAHTFDYSYDLAGHLSGVKKDGVTAATYAYDQNGNRVTFTTPGGSIAGSYDDQDRMTQYGAATYAYAANGELSGKTIGTQATAYSYDALGNLTNVTLPDGRQIAYLIDGLNRRIGKKLNGTQVQGFLYNDQLRPIAELDGSNNVVSRFIYASSSNVPDYMVNGGKTYRILTDQVGSPRLILDVSTGAIVQRLDYDEFGNVLTDTNPGFQPFGFAGGLYDRDTKLTRFGARDYDAETGRWTTKDPVIFAGNQTNLYEYAGNDPINASDPFGELSRLGKVLTVAAIVGLAVGAVVAGPAVAPALALILGSGLFSGAANIIAAKIGGSCDLWGAFAYGFAGGAAGAIVSLVLLGTGGAAGAAVGPALLRNGLLGAGEKGILATGLVGGVSGGASNAAQQAVSNVANGLPIDTGQRNAFLSGFFAGGFVGAGAWGASGGSDAFRTWGPIGAASVLGDLVPFAVENP